MGAEWLGWIATAVFTSSYLFRGESALRRVQMAGAVLWIVYGAVLGAAPVVTANALLLAAATGAAWRERRSARAP